MKYRIPTFLLALALAPAGCGDAAEKPAAPPAAGRGDASVEALHLAADPGEALAVADAKAKAPLDEAVVVGRIDSIVKGLATMTVVDASLDYCGVGGDPMENCETPWDYCCTAKDAKTANTMTVELVNAGGETLEASELPLRLLDLVAFRGKLEKDEHGNVTLLATGFFRRDRPKLPDGLRWPQ
jgi:hypothetical protein